MAQEDIIGQWLVQDGYLSEDQVQSALSRQRASFGKSLGEVLIESGYISEGNYLRTLAKHYNTQYVTSRKLSQVTIPQSVLDRVPGDLAEKFTLCPIQFRDGLTIVIDDPSNVVAIDELKFVTGINTVRALVALRSTVKSAIAKFYHGDQNAFGFGINLESEDDEMGMTGFTRQIEFVEEGDEGDTTGEREGRIVLRDEAPLEPPSEAGGGLEISREDEGITLGAGDAAGAPAPEREPTPPPLPRTESPPPAAGEGVFLGGLEEMPGDDNLQRSVDFAALAGPDPYSPEGAAEPAPSAPKQAPAQAPAERAKAEAQKRLRKMLVVEQHDQIRKFLIKLFRREGFDAEGVKTRDDALAALEKGQYDALVIKERDVGEGLQFEDDLKTIAPAVELSIIHDYGSAVMGDTLSYHKLMESYTGTMDIIISMLELNREKFQGHTHTVAKYTKLIARKLDLTQHETDEAVVAAYIHDLGKQGRRHLTLLDVADGASAEDIEEARTIPLRLLSSVNFPIKIEEVMESLFDRYDGKGNHSNLTGDDIPMAARIVAAVDAFEHLSSVGLTPDGPPVESADAMTLIKGKAGVLFDPQVVDTLLQVVKDDLFLGTMDSAREHILIVDDEAEFVTLLELKCAGAGYRVSVAKTAEEALAKVSSDMPDLVISEVDLPGGDGFTMIEDMQAAGMTAPFLFLSRKDDSASVTRGLDLGAEDYLTKPSNVELIFAKVSRLFSRIVSERTTERTSGVSGSLSEMDIPSIIQILGAGTKSGVVNLATNGRQGAIMIEQGRIVNAAYGELKGEEAFYELLKWNEGSFSISPETEITERLINKTNDSLLLEGFRRMDEENRGGGDAVEDIALDGSDFF